jgi:hypothetical protein
VRRGRDVGFLAGELLDAEGAIVAVATATVQIRPQMLQDRAHCSNAWRQIGHTSASADGIPVLAFHDP